MAMAAHRLVLKKVDILVLKLLILNQSALSFVETLSTNHQTQNNVMTGIKLTETGVLQHA